MIENWIDDLANVWSTISFEFGSVRSYSLIKQQEFPSAINPSELALNPVALTIPVSMQPNYSLSTKEVFWFGTTQFHVSPDLGNARIPGLMIWYSKILRAAAASLTLGGKVHSFIIQNEQNGILGPVGMAWGEETLHWGFLVSWRVKENPLSDLVVGV